MLSIRLAFGRPSRPRLCIDALSLYVAAPAWRSRSCARVGGHADEPGSRPDELVRRFTTLPAGAFPFTTRYATELSAGEGHDRFDFAMGLMIDGLRPGLGTS